MHFLINKYEGIKLQDSISLTLQHTIERCSNLLVAINPLSEMEEEKNVRQVTSVYVMY